jgi:hypothetical protein
MKTPLLVVSCLVLLPPVVHADSLAREAGRAMGELSVGFGEAVGRGAARAVDGMQPEWITIAPRPKADCLAESGGELNNAYLRCRNGWQEYVRFDTRGNKRVLAERAIPVN